MSDEILQHDCAAQRIIEPTPVFVVVEGLETKTKTPIKIVMLQMPQMFGVSRVQVDYCPWCTEKLAPLTLPELNRIGEKADSDMSAYSAYRKRWVRQGLPGTPMGLEDFNIAMNEWQELEFLLPHAKPEHADGLFRRKQVLRDRLALGVVLEEGKEQGT
jgi:hypothetical protein